MSYQRPIYMVSFVIFFSLQPLGWKQRSTYPKLLQSLLVRNYLEHPNTMLYLLANCGYLKSEILILHNSLAHLSVHENRIAVKEMTCRVSQKKGNRFDQG